jgi:hypothetical protein
MSEDVLDAPPEPEGDDQDASEGVEKPDIQDDDEGEEVSAFTGRISVHETVYAPDAWMLDALRLAVDTEFPQVATVRVGLDAKGGYACA